MKKIVCYLALCICLALHSFAQEKFAKGSIVKILEIAQSDAYYDERADFLGKNATALGDVTKNSEGYYSGTLELENGRTCFFKNVKVSKVSDTKRTFDSKLLFSGSTIPAGSRFQILEVPSDDAYYSSRADIEGKKGVTTSSLTQSADGYTSGSIATDDGKSFYFYKVRLGKAPGASTVTASSGNASNQVTYITGTIAAGTSVYVADLSSEDSYYGNRFSYIGKRGTVTSAMTMKSDGYYAGDFKYDDGTTAYFYKAKFSKEPITSSAGSQSTKNYSEWDQALNSDDVYEGDKVEIVAISPEDSYYPDKDKYVGKRGVAGDDIEYDDEEDGYGGTVTLNDGSKPYFYLVKLKRLGGSAPSASSSSAISKGTRIVVIDIDKADSYYSTKSSYIGKLGKVAEGLNLQGTDTYSGKVLFDDGTDAYFYKVKVTVLK
jgi:hypothetical protein